MKKRVLMLVFTLLLSVGLCLIPIIHKSCIPVMSITSVCIKNHTDTVIESGAIYNEQNITISCEYPICIADFFVSNGQNVKKGDLLFTVDMEQTEKAIRDNLLTDSKNLFGDVSSWLGVYENVNINNIKLSENFTASADGQVIKLNENSDKTYAKNEPILAIKGHGGTVVKINISEDDISKIKIGAEATVTVNALNNKIYPATVSNIADEAKKIVVGTTTKTVVEVTVTLKESDDDLKTGFSASVEIKTSEPISILLVPYDAVCQDENNVEFVYVYNNGKTVRRNIVTGHEFKEGVEVLSGLNTNDIIITSPIKITKNTLIVDVKDEESLS